MVRDTRDKRRKNIAKAAEATDDHQSTRPLSTSVVTWPGFYRTSTIPRPNQFHTQLTPSKVSGVSDCVRLQSQHQSNECTQRRIGYLKEDLTGAHCDCGMGLVSSAVFRPDQTATR